MLMRGVRLRRAVPWLVAAVVGGWHGLDAWVSATVLPPLEPAVSATVVDRDGRLLRAHAVEDGLWRLPVEVAGVDRGYLAQLVAFEDGRFYRHAGVDPLALIRAAGQAAWHGRVVSGGSTLTMQVARLLEDGPTGTIAGKLRQMRVALALERRLSKDEILGLYLTLAPYGGNVEGVRAASLGYFGKEPRRLTPAEAALLVALPQAPEARRPDRHPEAAEAGRARVLARAVAAGVLRPGDAGAAKRERVPTRRVPFPILAAHLADRLAEPGREVRLTLDARLQRALERLLAERAPGLGPRVSAALIVADHRTGEVLASVGSAGLFDRARRGWVDMTLASRSPGSTLKPLIYGLGFEAGIAHPESLVEDRPTAFGAYVPTNFDQGYQGTLTVREALQRSLNVPAVTVLDAVGPAMLLARMERAGMAPALPPGEAPGLAVGLGGVGVSLRDLTGLYAAIARGGVPVLLHEAPGPVAEGSRVLEARAAWQVGDILAGVPVPASAPDVPFAYKTGTSYGYRDAWAAGFDGRHVIAVWTGRPDGAPVPGMTGIDAAAPILFEALGRLKTRPDPLPPPPPGTLTVTNAELPQPLRRVRSPRAAAVAAVTGPEIAFPPDGARVDLGLGWQPRARLALKVRNGAAPFTWLVDGRPVETASFERETAWRPDGPGFVDIAVIDATGATARGRVFLE